MFVLFLISLPLLAVSIQTPKATTQLRTLHREILDPMGRNFPTNNARIPNEVTYDVRTAEENGPLKSLEVTEGNFPPYESQIFPNYDVRTAQANGLLGSPIVAEGNFPYSAQIFPYNDVTTDFKSLSQGRSGRILTRHGSWGDTFVQILTESSGEDPVGVVMGGGATCTRVWRRTLVEIMGTLGPRAPSILLSTINQNGTENIVYCQSYHHFLASVTSTTPASSGNTLSPMATLVEMLPHNSSLAVFTDQADINDGKLRDKLVTMALQKSCKLNIFYCQAKQDAKASRPKNPWAMLAEKTKGKFVHTDASSEANVEEISLVSRQGLSGTMRIPIPLDPSVLQLHFRVSGTVQKAILHTGEETAANNNNKNNNNNIDLFALQSHPAPPLSLHSGNLDPAQIPQQGQDPAQTYQGQRAELDVSVPVDRHIVTSHTMWLETRGVHYDVTVGGVREREGRFHGNQIRVGSEDLKLLNNSGLERRSSGPVDTKQDRIDTDQWRPSYGIDMAQSETRYSADFEKYASNVQSKSRYSASPDFDQSKFVSNDQSKSRYSGPANDRILSGFLVPEFHWGGPGSYPDKPLYMSLLGNELNGGSYQRGVSLSHLSHAMPPLSPVSLEVNQGSSLTALPGETVQIMFDLTNGFDRPVKFFFAARDQYQYVRNVHPLARWVDPYESVRVTVWLEAQGVEGTTDVVSFTAVGLDAITRNVYLNIGREIYDNTRPDISYSWKGDCENALTPDTCSRASWGIEAVVQDTESGLLKVISKPFPLRFRSNFIAGTREAVKVQYVSSCCFPKVDLIAYDVKGNVNKYTINVENRWLSWSQILAIVFGSILLIIVLILIGYAIARCIQVRRRRNFLGE